MGKAYYNACVRIVVLGAGDVGAAVAQQLAAANVISHVVLMDPAGSVATGKALDIAQAGPVDGYVTRVTGTDDETVVTGAAAVVLADAHGQPAVEWSGEAGLSLLARVARLCGRAPIVCAGALQSMLVERGVRELGLDRARLFGTAPEAMRAAVVSMVALEAEASPADISLLVVGRPPHDLIVSWEATSIAGQRAVDVLTPPTLLRLDGYLPRLWPPAPLTLGSAAARVLTSMFTRAPRTHVAQVAVTREEGPSAGSAMLPVRVGRHGITRVVLPDLSARDRVRLETVLSRP